MISALQFTKLTRLEQTLFGLPFVVTGALLPFADPGFRFEGSYWIALWILLAFMSARISGMAFNQLIDRFIDGRNPRTSSRPIPSGLIQPKDAAIVAWTGLLAFLLFSFQINGYAFIFGPIVAALLVLYSYMKRFHASCHFVLGAIHFLAPFLAWLAVTEKIAWPPVFLGFGAFFWLSGNDMIYGLKDYAFDCREGLHSIPSRFGPKKTLIIARVSHLCSIASLIVLGLILPLGLFYFMAPMAAAVMMIILHRQGAEAPRLFFLSVVVLSFSVMIFTLVDILWRVWL